MDNKILSSKLKKVENKYREACDKIQNFQELSRDRDTSLMKIIREQEMEEAEKLNNKITQLIDLQVKYEDKIN